MPLPRTWRRYDPAASAVFRRTRDRWGELSNFAPCVIGVNGLTAYHSEGLYQACRFPDRADIQRMVCAERNPMTSKQVAHKHVELSRSDWMSNRIATMRWVLRVKLAQHFDTFGQVLENTGDMPIVEYSRFDDYWGADYQGEHMVGQNALGRLLMELREELRERQDDMRVVSPPRLEGFRINGGIVAEMAHGRSV